MDEWGGKPRESVTVMPPPPLNARRGSGQAGPPFPSARARTAGTGDPPAYQPSRVSNLSEAAKLQNREAVRSETRFRRNASDPISGPLAFFHFFSVWGTCATQQCRPRESARRINGARKGVRLATGTRKGRAPPKRGAQGKREKQERGRKETSYMKSRAKP